MDGEQLAEVPRAAFNVSGSAAGEGVAAHALSKITDTPRGTRRSGSVDEQRVLQRSVLTQTIEHLGL
jgi:hypothetical protein